MTKKHRKTTMPAIVPNQPQLWWWGRRGSDGAKFRAEHHKNERNRRHLIRSPEQPPPNLTGFRNLLGVNLTKPIIRAKTRIRVYKSVRTINN